MKRTFNRLTQCKQCGIYFERLYSGGRCEPCSDEYRKRRYRHDNRTRRLRKTLIPQRGNKCERCQSTDKDLFLHHIVPVDKGGESTPENLKVVCHDCHLLEHNGGWRNL